MSMGMGRGARWSGLGLIGLAALVGCGRPDLADPVPGDRVLAGVIEEEDALFGGTAAEGQVGDVLIQNSVVRFVIQGARDDGHYYESVGGGIIDADVARPQGQPGRDPVDEWTGMFGLGRITRASQVEVVDRGWRSGEAVVRVTSQEVPLSLFTGALESPNLVPDLGLTVVTDYVLRPGAHLLEVRSTVTAGDEDVELAPGDVLQGGLESVQPWDPGVGLQAPGEDERRFTAYLGRHNEGAWAIVPDTGKTAVLGSDGQLLASVGDLVATFGDKQALSAGESLEYVRYYGVGDDLAQLTDEILRLAATPTRTESGVVTAGGDPVAGARVHVLIDGEPFTVAFTDAEGRWQADVPEGASVSVRASGMLDGVWEDLPPAFGRWGPYAASAANQAAFGSVELPAAEGYGLAPEGSQELVAPAWLTVRSSDGAPFEVRVLGERAPVDERLASQPPDGTVALAWARDGEVRLAVPPGPVTVQAHRGLRFERDRHELTLASGEEAQLDVSLAPAISPAGWVVADPHSHASPSGDGRVPMESRLIGSAARGIQVHVGTDHDHVADYRPLVGVLGLSAHLRSVVANEVSPPTRGHLNAWPLSPQDAPNGGAVRWWTELPESTDELVSRFPSMGGGERVFVQANHPLESSGVADAARWRPGRIGSGDRWTERLDLIEVNNAGTVDENLELFFDLVTRGYRVVPVAVSDAHGPTSGGLGLNVTFLGTGTDLAGADDAALRQALGAGRTIASRGVFLDLSQDPGSTLTGSTTLTVQATSPTWAPVTRIRLFENGVPTQTAPGTQATFDLNPESDAVYVIIAEGDEPMGGPYGSQTPWAMASPVYVDVDGDGWDAPKEGLGE